MHVGVWLGLHWVLFSFFDHYIQSSLSCHTYAIGEDAAAHGHWCTFTDFYYTIPINLQRSAIPECIRACQKEPKKKEGQGGAETRHADVNSQTSVVAGRPLRLWPLSPLAPLLPIISHNLISLIFISNSVQCYPQELGTEKLGVFCNLSNFWLKTWCCFKIECFFLLLAFVASAVRHLPSWKITPGNRNYPIKQKQCGFKRRNMEYSGPKTAYLDTAASKVGGDGLTLDNAGCRAFEATGVGPACVCHTPRTREQPGVPAIALFGEHKGVWQSRRLHRASLGRLSHDAGCEAKHQ